jgi:hypothetical protein
MRCEPVLHGPIRFSLDIRLIKRHLPFELQNIQHWHSICGKRWRR